MAHSIQYVPTVTGRFSYLLERRRLCVRGPLHHPGNGLFLTSTATKLLAGYTYTGVRRWSFNMEGGYMRSNAISINSWATITEQREACGLRARSGAPCMRS